MLALIALVACSPKAGHTPPEDSDILVAPDTDLPEFCPEDDGTRDWSLFADQLGVGVLLGAWSDGDEVVAVGGQMDGGKGGLVRIAADGSVCTEPGVAKRALWWIHGPAPGEWYAVGEAGTIVHQVGNRRLREDVPTDVTLYGVWAEGDTAIAVGGDPFTADSGEVWVRRNGSWQQQASGLPGTLFKVWEGHIVGDQVAYTWDGNTLTEVTQSEKLLTVRGRNSRAIWAVGGTTGPVVSRWDAGRWKSAPTTGLTQPLAGVWTDAGEDLWVAGFSGTTARWDGDAWEMPSPPPSTEHFHAVWKHCADVLFLGGNLFSVGNNHGTIVRYGPKGDAPQVEACR